jgi:hypothetical protein
MFRLAISATALFAAASLWACSNPNAPPGNYGSVAGKVTNSSGQPVAGVIVEADYGPTSAPSAADGSYTINYVPVTDPLSPATVAVKSVPSGYGIPAPQTNVQVQSGQTTQGINFVLPPA